MVESASMVEVIGARESLTISFSGLLAGDELLEADVLNHLADNSVLEFEVVDLELGSLWDEVHLSLSLLRYNIILNNKESVPPLAT